MAEAKTTAKNRQDVEGMSTRDRLWDSMNYTYGQQREASDKSYDQAYTQADNQLLRRGMQRSSYGMQTLAGIDRAKIDAQNNIYSSQIADYENRLQQIEQDEQEQNNWERQFAEGVRQYDENLAFQKEQAAQSQSNWQAEFNYNQSSGAQQMAYNYVSGILANGQMPSASLLAQAGLTEEDAKKLMTQLRSSGSGRKPNNGEKKPWELLGMSEEEYNKQNDWVKKYLAYSTTGAASNAASNIGILSGNLSDFFSIH